MGTDLRQIEVVLVMADELLRTFRAPAWMALTVLSHFVIAAAVFVVRLGVIRLLELIR